VAVLSLGGMVIAKSLDIAGDEMNDAIVQYFRRKYNLMIGENTAEDVKIKIGSVFTLEEELSLEVKGRDQVTGLPKTVTISSEEIRQALYEPMKAIIELIKSTLEETPAELSADLVDRGIVLAGGGSLLRGLPELLSQETELPVRLANDPVTCVVRGTGKYLEELDNLKKAHKNLT
jgi:rod shape-determining protein MreB